MGRRTAVAAVAVSALAALGTPAAHAVPCDSLDPLVQSRPDAEGGLVSWYPRADAGLGVGNSGVIDDLARPALDFRGAYDWATPGGANDCARSANGRHVTYPYRPDPLGSGALIAQKVYVPSLQIWARTITFAHNPTARPLTLSLWSMHRNRFPDGQSSVLQDSSGNFAVDAADIFAVFQSTSDNWRHAFMWQHANPRRRASSSAVMAAGPSDPPPPGRALTDADSRMAINWRLDLAPGETRAVMHFAAYGPSNGVGGVAQALAGGFSQEQFADLEPAEARAIVNWMVEPDADMDTVDNGQDNCLYVPNPDQANTDFEAEVAAGRYYEGDACDEDDDDDGVSDTDEATRGSDPRKADTDGDGVLDGTDRCPAVFARGRADGCPPPDPVLDTRAPRVTLRGVPKRLKLRTLRSKGITCRVRADEPVGLNCRLVARLRGSAKLAAAGEIELASGSVRRGAGERRVRLRPSAKVLRGVRRFTAYLVVSATDASANRTTLRRKILVR